MKNKKKTHNTGSSVKKRRRKGSSNPDLISVLPDSLLLHILSLLDDTREVIRTSLISRRWRYLWRSVPCLLFFWDTANYIDKCLFHHDDSSKLQKLHIDFNYEEEDDKHALLVDSWLNLAIKCKVEDLVLQFYDDVCFHDVYDDDKLYRLPHYFYLCTTLTSLYLRQCNLNLPDSFQLSSLKTLSLQHLELFPDSIQHLSSSCPLLEEIYLIDCNRGRDLINIVITNENVKKLVISNFGDDESETVKINAPTLLFLRIYHCCSTVRFHIEELGSLMTAEVFGKVEALIWSEGDDVHHVEMLLYDFRHVNHLKLAGVLLQVLSLIKLNSSDIFPISATSLELNARLEKWELPGISYLLKCCSNLQKLKIVNGNYRVDFEISNEIIDEHDFKEEEYWESFESDVQHSMVQNIKTIEIDLGGESRHEEFVRFLLKNAKVLERMVIHTPKKHANNFELLFKLSQRLNAFPRTLISLALWRCNLNLPYSFQLSSLEKLTFEHLKISYESFEHVSSSHPLLEDYLLDCNRESDVHIVITNEHVKGLRICQHRGFVGSSGSTHRAFFHLQSITAECWPRAKFHVEELGSLMSVDNVCEVTFASFYATECFDKCNRNDLGELLYDLCHVQRLKLCNWCVKILSVREMQILDPLCISATCLELQESLTKWELLGISYLLKCCSDLENLKIIVKEDWIDEI